MIEQGLAVYTAWNIAHKQLSEYNQWYIGVLEQLQNINLDLVGIEVYNNLKARELFFDNKRWELMDYCKLLSTQF